MTRSAATIFLPVLALVGALAMATPAAQTMKAAATAPALARPFRNCRGCPAMIALPRGEFLMGSVAVDRVSWPDEISGLVDEQPRHSVTLAQRFALGRAPVTVGEFRAFVRATGYAEAKGCNVWENRQVIAFPDRNWSTPGFAQTREHPVVCVSWHDASAYAAWLARRTGKAYRLPTEAEWEYAARAGTVSFFYSGDTLGFERANLGGGPFVGGVMQGKDRWLNTSPVGAFDANPWGLWDMAGNVYQWVADCPAPSYEGASSDGSARSGDTAACKRRMLRGGAWNSKAVSARSANRDANEATMRMPFYGFRLALTLPD